MAETLDLFYAKGSECNPVKIGGRTELIGDPEIKREKPHTIIGFPGGDVEIARTEDGNYWVHVAVRTDHRGDGDARPAGRIIRARVDADGRYSDAANAALSDEIAEGGVNHIAFLIEPSRKPAKARPSRLSTERDA
jgi:hypothetical protein